MSHSESDTSTSESHIRVQLSVTPKQGAGCAILESGGRGTVTMHETLRPGGIHDRQRECKAETTADGASEPRLLEDTVKGHCVCPVFSKHDCLASLEGFENGTLFIDVAVPNRDVLSTVVAALREKEATVNLRRISSAAVETGTRMLELDADGITDKQREAVQTAVRDGYYETPRRADLSDLAEQLDVSRSAVSQRLTAVESKLVEALFRADSSGVSSNRSTATDD